MSLKNDTQLAFRDVKASVLENLYVCITDDFPDAVVVLDEAEAIALRNWLNEVLAA